MADIGTVGVVGFSGSQCMAQWVLQDCGKPNWSPSYAFCAAKFLLVPSAVCLAKTAAGQAQLAKLAGPEAAKAVNDLSGGAMDELLAQLPTQVKGIAGCIVDKAGADAYVAVAEAVAGDVDKAAKRLAPYAAGCGLLEVADQLGTGLFSDILRKIAGQLTAAPKPEKTKVVTGYGLKDICYYHYEKGSDGKKLKVWRCPGDPGYQSINNVPIEKIIAAANSTKQLKVLLDTNQQLLQQSYGDSSSDSQQPAMLPLLLLGVLVWAVA